MAPFVSKVSSEEGKYQELIQSSITPDLGHHMVMSLDNPWTMKRTFGITFKSLTLIASASNEGSGEPTHVHS